MLTVNRDLRVPLYHQVKTLVLKGIEEGHWKPDDQLPTEDELISRFQVSKVTIRQALRELASEGYIRREQGRGTFVERPTLEQGPRELTSFTDEMRRHGLVSASRVLEQGIVAAPPEAATTLAIVSADPVVRLRRLRLADGEPMGLQTAYIPMKLVPGIDQIDFAAVGSLYELLGSRYGLYPVKARETHRAVPVTAEEADLLRIAPTSPALAAERVTYLADQQPLEYVQSIMRGDRYKIVLDLVNTRSRRQP